MSKTKALRRATALALSAALALSVGYAAESGANGEYTATSDWITGTFNGEDSITITYTIPEGTNYSRINFPVFESAENGFPIYDENGELLGNWTWVPSDSADITIRVVDETGNYLYDSGSLWIGTKEFDPTNPGEVVNRSYNPALYALIGIEQYSAGDNDDVEEQLTDEALGALLVEAGWENGIEDLDDYYCSYYGVSSLDQLPDETLESLFSGRWKGTFTGMYDATGNNETNEAVAQIGWKNLYYNLFTVDGTGILEYDSDYDPSAEEKLTVLDAEFASSLTADAGETFHIEIDGLKTTNCYQNHEIYLGLSFSMSLPGTEQTPDPDPDPGDGDDEEPYDGPELTIVKVDEEGETITSPATFHIYKEQGDKVLWRMSGGRWSEDEEDAWSYTTRDGETTCYDLKPGTYYIVEISAPEGYDLAEEPLEVEVESRDVTVEFVNSGDGVVTTPTKPVPDTGR